MSLKTRDLTPTIATEILDVDVRDLTEADFTQLRELWKERIVLVFRNQRLSDEDQQKFSRGMGELYTFPDSALDQPGVQGKYTMVISNQLVDGKIGALPDGEMWFHFDLHYTENPAKAGVLYGMQIPTEGGCTRFANAVAAYKQLPQEVKDKINGLHAEQVYDYRSTTSKVEPDPDALRSTHPVVIRIPESHKPGLYVSRLMTNRIVELSDEESESTLNLLCEQLEDENLMYEHHWKVGDLVVWDNNACLHARTDFNPTEARMLRRMSLANREAISAYAG